MREGQGRQYNQRMRPFCVALFDDALTQIRKGTLLGAFLRVFEYQYNLYLSLRLSAIIAMNSEFVGFPRLFWMVYPK